MKPMPFSSLSRWFALWIAAGLWAIPWTARSSEEAPTKAVTAEKSKTEAHETPAAPASGHGEAPAATPVPTPRVGPPLNGYFDLSVLRSGSRVAQFRLKLEPLIVQLNGPQRAEIHATVEFGIESGVAELGQDLAPVMEELRGVTTRYTMAEMLTTAGKLRLKDEMAEVINRHLKTAQVRQIYFTNFRVAR
jgi:hypothetical protein